MTVGVEVKSKNGNFLIHDGFSNPNLVKKGTISLFSDYITYTAPKTVFAPGVAPILMFANATGGGGICVISKTAVPGGFNFGVMTHSRNVSYGAVITAEYFVFDIGIPSPSSFGLQIFNAAGNLKFDSQSKFLRIKDMVSGGGYMTNPYQVPAGKKYAACLVNNPFLREPYIDSHDGSELVGYGIYPTLSGISVDYVAVDEGRYGITIGTPSQEYLTPRFLVADVTGY